MTVQSDIDERLQPPEVSKEIESALQPIIGRLPSGYRIETGGNIEDSGIANSALAPVFPIMIALTLLVLVIQVRSLSAMAMVFLTAPLGLIGTVPILLLFHQPFGFNAILGLSGILMRRFFGSSAAGAGLGLYRPRRFPVTSACDRMIFPNGGTQTFSGPCGGVSLPVANPGAPASY